jgi:hypothetical protein
MRDADRSGRARLRRCLGAMTAVVLVMTAGGAAGAQEVGFQVARLVVAGGIDQREPVGVAETFGAGQEAVYCFLEAREIVAHTEVVFVWYHGDREAAVIPVRLVAGPRWRTFTHKQVSGLRGNWKVYLQDGRGQVVGSVDFVVE